MPKPKIVIVLHNLIVGGAEIVMLNLAREFSKQGGEVHIVISENIIRLDVGNLKIHHFKYHYRWLPKKIRGRILAPFLDRFIRKNCGKPNLVLSNLLLTDRLLADSHLNVYFVIHNTTSKEQSKKLKMLATIYAKKPAICVSKGVMNDFIKIFPKLKFPPKYIYNGIDTRKIEKLSTEKSPLKIENYIIHIGSFKYEKRHDILIKAYHRAKIKTPLVIVGNLEGKIKNVHNTQKLVEMLNLKNQVIFVGLQSNPYPLIKAAKFLVLSSDFEGLPTVILEACALKIPAISTDCPSGANEILPSENLCSVGNIEALAKLMQKADKNPEQYRVPLAQKFTLDFATERYLELLK